MIIAEIENKIRSDFDVTRSEDILTSIVFGRLRYMAPNVLLIPFLSKAKLAFNSGSFEKLLESAFDKVDYHFWPNFNSGKEGDLLLILRKNRHPDQTILILVEVKYFSGKSSREKLGSKDNFIGEDQLAHYFCQLMQNSFESKLENQLATIPKSNRFMVYLTKHRYKPENELKESLRSMVFKSDDRKYFRDHFKKQFFWLSWRELERIISGLNAKHGSYVGENRTIIKDLKNFLHQRNLVYSPLFSGFDFGYRLKQLPTTKGAQLFYDGTKRYEWPKRDSFPELNKIFYLSRRSR